jgi:hypothetical protein
MDALFIELPPFQRYRQDYLDDELFRSLQLELLKAPEAGDLIEGTGGLRKIRFVDERRHKGKRGGIRVIYYWVRRRPVLALHPLRKERAERPDTPTEKTAQATVEQRSRGKDPS